ncbi:hypothetical protein Q428_11785 [Fervidicella metallireducens AeB]|uniref:Large ribosomal subunit protein uL29 n=1 Tax=Fervidicella metallireducens AeB TaxID=1403537 RepID=A0A017RSS2_9CLOT|nr:hypothetical protein Q428_11785 [Fervidicella metallireducens AeB]
MKANELKTLRENSAAELQKKVMELKAELFNLRFNLQLDSLKTQ